MADKNADICSCVAAWYNWPVFNSQLLDLENYLNLVSQSVTVEKTEVVCISNFAVSIKIVKHKLWYASMSVDTW